MNTTVALYTGSQLTLGNTLHCYPELNSTDWFSIDAPITVPVLPPAAKPPVQVAPLPRAQRRTVAARHRALMARNRKEQRIAGGVAFVMACVTIIMSVNLVIVLRDLVSMSAG